MDGVVKPVKHRQRQPLPLLRKGTDEPQKMKRWVQPVQNPLLQHRRLPLLPLTRVAKKVDCYLLPLLTKDAQMEGAVQEHFFQEEGSSPRLLTKGVKKNNHFLDLFSQSQELAQLTVKVKPVEAC
jgi:hypothetical protein